MTKESTHAAARVDGGSQVYIKEACDGWSHSGDRSGQVQQRVLLVRHGDEVGDVPSREDNGGRSRSRLDPAARRCKCREMNVPDAADVRCALNRSYGVPTDQDVLSPCAVQLFTGRGHI